MATRYTSQQRTRIMDRAHQDEPQEHASIGNTQLIPRKQGLFDGLSAAQIIAAAAAAATAMVLSSRIGIAGSAIGAALSSVVTVVSSQLYRNFLDAGARKLKDGSILPNAHANSATGGAHAQQGSYGTQAELYAPTSYIPGGMPQTGAPGTVRGARVAPVKLQARAAAHRSKTQRRVVVFSLLIAVLVLGIYVAVLLWGTAGEGLGTRPEPLFTPTTQAQTQDDTSEPLDEAEEMPTTGTNAGDNANAGTTDGTSSPSTEPAEDSTDTGDSGAGEPSAGDAPAADTPGSTGTASDTGSGTGAGTKNSSDAPASASAA